MNIGVRYLRLVPKANGTIHCHETILENVQKAPDEIQWQIDKQEFDEILATKKRESAPGPDGIPYRIYWCAGGLGSCLLFDASRFVVEGGSIPTHFVASRTVFIPKSSTVHDNGRIVRSPDVLRPLTLCTCDCKIVTSAIFDGLHRYTHQVYTYPALRCISSRQMTDNIFEWRMWHALRKNLAISLTDFAAAYPIVNHSWIFHVLEKG